MPPPPSLTLAGRAHATLVALGDKGVLLVGPSGSGKSDLALRLIDGGARLVADDQVLLAPGPGEESPPVGTAPPALAGLLEVRGLGLVTLPFRPRCAISLVIALRPGAATGTDPDGGLDRLPPPATAAIAGRILPLIALDPFTAAAAAKVRLAVALAEGDTLCGVIQDCPPPDRSVAATGSRPETADGAGRPCLVLMTGLSGAGRSTALKLLEDSGFEAVDNMPLSLLGAVTAQAARPLVLGLDTRTRGFSVPQILAERAQLGLRRDWAVKLVFLTCDDDVLQRRFTETRRRHPLALDRSVMDGIATERPLLEPLRLAADLVIDTTALAPADCRALLLGQLGLGAPDALTLNLVSFAFRNGLPRAADLVFDVRFLRNPHYDPALRPRDGRDPAVAAYIEADCDVDGFFDSLTRLLAPLLPRYRAEGKSYLTIAFGCTGGQHRSVYLTERLATWLRGRDPAGGLTVTIRHRELPGRPDDPPPAPLAGTAAASPPVLAPAPAPAQTEFPA